MLYLFNFRISSKIWLSPASSAFSMSSLPTFAGRSITSPPSSGSNHYHIFSIRYSILSNLFVSDCNLTRSIKSVRPEAFFIRKEKKWSRGMKNGTNDKQVNARLIALDMAMAYSKNITFFHVFHFIANSCYGIIPLQSFAHFSPWSFVNSGSG